MILSNIVDTLDLEKDESILCDTRCKTNPSIRAI